MKRNIAILLTALIMILSGCNNVQNNPPTLEKDFKFASLSWGDNWESVRQAEIFQNIETEIVNTDDIITDIRAKEINFYGYTVDAMLSFGNKDFADKGLCRVTLRYNDYDEGNILAQMEEIYGERTNSFTDKNGARYILKISTT